MKEIDYSLLLDLIEIGKYKKIVYPYGSALSKDYKGLDLKGKIEDLFQQCYDLCIVDLMSVKDNLKVPYLINKLRMKDKAFIVISKKEDYLMILAKNNSIGYLEDDEKYVLYFNLDLPLCENCLEVKEGIIEDKAE